MPAIPGRPRPWEAHRTGLSFVHNQVEISFNPRPPHGGRPGTDACGAGAVGFNPRPPHGGRPAAPGHQVAGVDVSIRAPRTGGDRSRELEHPEVGFNPRPPHGGRRMWVAMAASTPGRFNPRPPHGGRRVPAGRRPAITGEVSIRAPRTGGDLSVFRSVRGMYGFNPRPPHGGRQVGRYRARQRKTFQSAPPARGATDLGRGVAGPLHRFQSAPPARGRRRDKLEVSIGPPQGATRWSGIGRIGTVFQSAPPARGATPGPARSVPDGRVSIRAPRTGGDH